MDTEIKTFTIQKLGRKFIQCLIGTYKAKLILNDVSRDFEPGQTVQLLVHDLSTRSKYGSSMTFEPIDIATDKAVADSRHAQETAKWLSFAESDAADGYCTSNAIDKMLRWSPMPAELQERREALVQRVEANRKARHEKWQREAEEREQERAALQKQSSDRRKMRTLYPTSDLPPMDVAVRRGSSVVVFESTGQTFHIGADHPSIHGSHLLGHEGELGCYCYYRRATADEVAELETQEQRAEIHTATAAEQARAIDGIKQHFRDQGEVLEGNHDPQGERLLDTQNLQGSGEWFVLTKQHIWYVINHGMDGDAWEANNVLTGGAGAIGYRLPYTATLAMQLRALNSAK